MVNFRDNLSLEVYGGILVLILLYAAFLFAGPIIVDFFFSSYPFIIYIWIQFLILMILLTLLWFFIVPFGFKLPEEVESFTEYAEIIKLSKVKPIKLNLGLGVLFAAVLWLCSLIYSLLAGEYIFDPNVIFGAPTEENLGIFLFVKMLRPGLWEEIAFRGVILTLLLKKFSVKKSIIIDGILFGLMHFFNLIGGQDLFSTISQVIYASTLGFAFAYLFIRTESLIPCIISHYLINAVNPLFNNFNPTVNTFFSLFYAVIFIVILPPLINIYLIKIISDKYDSV
ncbi:MAG: CAAX amino terminal protease self-immunity [Promethearchaeota archaeon]|nr:MAG: CAAX amino terminal protease self-immunity [Candidatus Lokiarchaeota archaeon]